jgi:predicted alpha-1,2-mannosidase
MRRAASFAISLALLCASLIAVPGALAQTTDYTQYVDPMIGTYPPGFVNPGPVRPFGMVALGPDTEGPLNYGGYHYINNTIVGFSHTHMSAGVFRAGQVPMMPVAGPVELNDRSQQVPGIGTESSPIPGYSSPFSHSAEVAEPGYYSVLLERYGITAELTSTERVGVHRYTFPPAVDASIVMDPTRDLRGYQTGSIEVDPDGIVTGHATTDDESVDVYFAAQFDKEFEAAPFTGAQPDRPGLVLDFGTDVGQVIAKVGISFTDVQGARTNLVAETTGRSFDDLRQESKAAWNDALSLVEVEGGTDAEKTSFYTALYHTQFFPNLFSDADGRYKVAGYGARSGQPETVATSPYPRYTQFSLWDSYRGQNQILSVIQPERYRDMVRSLVDMYRETGYLPRWTYANQDPGHMSGNPVIPFIGEGWCRGVLDDFTAEEKKELFDAMLERTQNNPGGDYEQRGYAPVDELGEYFAGIPQVHRLHDEGGGNAGTTLEYGLADFSLALMADELGLESERDSLLDRATFYRNLLDPETKWIRPRYANGDWMDPFVPETDYGFQEGTSWQYSWLAMQDLRGLFDRMGGDAAVQERLDQFFNLPASGTAPVVWPKVQNQATMFGLLYKGNQYAPGNEHDLQAPFLYNYAGAPWKTQAVARGAASLYTATPDGLPGNDDLGALSGALVWTMLGVYPVTPGSPTYTIASPVFTKATIHLPHGDFVIDSPAASTIAKFIQSATFTDDKGDTTAQDTTWFTHGDIRKGATLTLDMGPVPDMEWGTRADAAPPSIASSIQPDGDIRLRDFACGAGIKTKGNN